jgi:DNA helicase IV
VGSAKGAFGVKVRDQELIAERAVDLPRRMHIQRCRTIRTYDQARDPGRTLTRTERDYHITSKSLSRYEPACCTPAFLARIDPSARVPVTCTTPYYVADVHAWMVSQQ